MFVKFLSIFRFVTTLISLSLQLAAQRPENSGGAAFIPPRIFPDPAELNQQQSGLLKAAAELEQQSGFLNGHTSRVPTAAEEQEEEDSSQASLELIQQTRKPEFSAPGIGKEYAFGRLLLRIYIYIRSSLISWQSKQMVAQYYFALPTTVSYVKLISDVKPV